jgi:16S rRNA processing protein RimM
MIAKENCMLLGTLVKLHGTGGSLLLKLKLESDDIREMGSVFVEIDGLLVPFYCEIVQEKTTHILVLKFHGIDSGTEAKALANCNVYIAKDQIKRKKHAMQALVDLSGYRVTDIKTGFTGIAGKITGTAMNPLLVVKHENTEHLVPFHEDIIRSVDHHTREILVDAPEGLFEL